MSKKETDGERTFKQGVVGGIAGAFLGVPGLGIIAGVAHANKDKLKTCGKKFDKFLSNEK